MKFAKKLKLGHVGIIFFQTLPLLSVEFSPKGHPAVAVLQWCKWSFLVEQRPHGFPQFEGFNAKVDFLFCCPTPQKNDGVEKSFTRAGCGTRNWNECLEIDHAFQRWHLFLQVMVVFPGLRCYFALQLPSETPRLRSLTILWAVPGFQWHIYPPLESQVKNHHVSSNYPLPITCNISYPHHFLHVQRGMAMPCRISIVALLWKYV